MFLNKIEIADKIAGKLSHKGVTNDNYEKEKCIEILKHVVASKKIIDFFFANELEVKNSLLKYSY